MYVFFSRPSTHRIEKSNDGSSGENKLCGEGFSFKRKAVAVLDESVSWANVPYAFTTALQRPYDKSLIQSEAILRASIWHTASNAKKSTFVKN